MSGEKNQVELTIGDDIKTILIKNLQFDNESHIPMHVDFYQVTQKQKITGSYKHWPYVMGTFIALSLLLFVFFIPQGTSHLVQNSEKNKKVLAIETQKEQKRLPVRLIIPRINVDATVEYMGITSTGAMDVPKNTSNVGWYKLGPIPGERGSAVIGGHFNAINGAAGVFANLDQLKEGDKLYIEDDKGKTIPFVVRESRTYFPGYADDVFSPNDIAHLNLITCDGMWDETKKSYTKRLVVFADISIIIRR